MSEATAGGVTRKTLTGRSARGLLTYEADVPEGKEPPLFSATRHCSSDLPTQILEWKAVRELHGTNGAKRAPKAKYETVDPETGLHASGQKGTHVKEWDGKRNRKRPVRHGEMPTHLRVETDNLMEKESEAVHTIYAAGADLVNPQNIEDCEHFFNLVKAERDELYSGLQEKLWLERNGESGLVHVHVASNATIYRAFTLDGVDYKAGQKMAGELTRVHTIRDRSDQFLDAHPEHGFSQSLARVGTQEYQDAQLRSSQKDYWDAKRRKESAHDQVRRKVYEALVDSNVHDRDTFITTMADLDVDVIETGLRRGKPGKNHDYSYKIAGAKQAVRGKTLGAGCGYNAVGKQLDLKALGHDIELPERKQQTGLAKPLPFEVKPLSGEQHRAYDQMVSDVRELAQREREEQVRLDQHRKSHSSGELLADATGGTPVDLDMPFRDRYLTAEATSTTAHQPTAMSPEPAVEQQPATGVEPLAGQSFEEMVAEVEASLGGDADLLDVDDHSAHEQETPAKVEDLAVKTSDAVDELEGQYMDEQEPETQVQPEPVEPPRFRSKLRDVESGEFQKPRRKLEGLAQLEEDYRGRRPDAEFEQRIADKEGEIRGVGPKFLKHYGHNMDEDLRGQLENRREHQLKTDEANRLDHEHGDRAKYLASRGDLFKLQHADEIREDKWQQRFHAGRVERLRSEQAEGVYNQDTPGARQEFENLKRHVSDRAADIEPTEAQQRVQESKERLRGDRAAAKSRPQDQGMEM
ncbi:hypothetical protein [Spelaeicoccus albus]|uniref:Uncharacterized protein n=1 Tax=Spelaeicoccus albus TaxID=1280376 RepID=A0A7Z0A7X0_9MICO|nr:hypothetical protein [Spelaeicoccus albus]NYI66082.1 hypothetical protein [Spelaeicoccus albus]